jgi:hypothetical protein
MKLNWIYILGLWLIGLCSGCTDNELIKLTPEGTIGENEVYTTLRFSYEESEKINISTRATLGVVPESRVQNLFIYLFVGEQCVYTHYFDGGNRLPTEVEVEDAKWNCWFVENLVEGENTTPTNGVIRMQTADITNGTLFLIANIDADMVNISPEKLNTIRTKNELEKLTANLNQQITSRNGYFPMTGELSPVNTANLSGTLQLKRIDAKVRFWVKIGNDDIESFELKK